MKGITPIFHQNLMKRLELHPLLREEADILVVLWQQYQGLMDDLEQVVESYYDQQAQALHQETRLRRRIAMDSKIYSVVSPAR